MDYNTVAGMQITVPASRPHVTITHVSVDVTTARENLDPSFCCGNQYSFFWLVASGQTVFEQEMGGWSQAIDRDTPASRDLQAAIYCSFGNGPQPCHWEGGTGPLIGLSQLRLTLQESDPPTAQATGGTLLSGGTLRGTQTLSYTADRRRLRDPRRRPCRSAPPRWEPTPTAIAAPTTTGTRARCARTAATCRSTPAASPTAPTRSRSWSPTRPATPPPWTPAARSPSTTPTPTGPARWARTPTSGSSSARARPERCAWSSATSS